MHKSIHYFSLTLFFGLGLGNTVHAADIAETVDKSGEIKIFSEALKNSGIDKRLKENGPYTVFAPSNSAFQKISPDTRNALFKDRNKLASFVSRHILPKQVLVDDVKPGAVETIQGENLRLKSDNGKITVNEANVVLSDIEADNGVIHIVDTLLVDP